MLNPMHDRQGWKIEVVPESRFVDLRQQLQRHASDHAVTGLLEAAEGDAIELWAASDDSNPVAVAAVQWQPGSTASITGPWFNVEEAARALIESVLTAARWRQLALVQALTELDHGPAPDLLKRSDFAHVADLLYLVSLKSSFPDAAPNSSISLERHEEPQKERLVRLIERTYQGTLDCPTLNGVRSIYDAVEGYRSIGAGASDLWSIATHESQDVGCLLLAEHPAHSNLEVVYVGVTPEHRGQGFGVELTRHAQWIARERGLDRVVLAVDAANSPALKMYASAGFVGWDRRSVWVHALDRHS
jgi:ribosomal protein S18 acetylase RimI-like enzyme